MVAAKRNDVAFIVMLAGVAVDFFEDLYVQDSLSAVSEGLSADGVKNIWCSKNIFSTSYKLQRIQQQRQIRFT